jgi:hypothetical protein
MKDKSEAFVGSERFENDEQGKPERIGQKCFVLGVNPIGGADDWLRNTRAERFFPS